MRFMVLVKATKDSEAGAPPTRELVDAMMAYNEELVKAGIMKGGDGLQPSAKGARVQFDGERRSVVDGPFAETKELVAGYWIWECKSLDEAIDWVKRCPNPMPGSSEIEIRPVVDIADFGEMVSPEAAATWDRLKSEIG
ncbi:YciI family protein [Bosea sp. NPDC055332]